MSRSVIKSTLKEALKWNYFYFNVLDEKGRVVASFDFEDEARSYLKSNMNVLLFIQKVHNISFIL